jgi:hypothetical protein
LFKHFLIAVALGVLGLVIGTLIAWGAVSTWTTLSTNWINSGMVWPTLGLDGGLALAGPHIGQNRGKLRAALMAVAMPLCGFANYLAFIITSRTWFSDRIPEDSQSLIYQIMHPDIMPTFVHTTSSSSHGLEQTWVTYLCIGLIAGPLIFFWSTRPAKK